MVEQRRSHRSPLDAIVQVKRKGGDETAAGKARDVSVGGLFVETPAPFAFGTEVVVLLRLPGHKDELAMPATVRWTGQDGMGLQFGLLGARETYAITEIVRAGAKPKTTG
jgi:type IV pilus assembly protein PilZ